MKKPGIKVLLVLANSFMDNLIPLNVSILAACLKRAGHEVKLFDTTFYRTRKETGDDARVRTLQVRHTNLADFGIYPKETDMVCDFKKLVNEFKPNLIGVSVVEITYQIGLCLLNSVRDLGIPTIMGGIHVTFAPQEVINEAAVDMVCVGEGEGAIVDLANRLRDGKDYTDIPNLWVKRGDKIYRNPVRSLAVLDELPKSDWDIYEKERFYKPMGGKIYIAGSFEMNRGCPYDCTFCCNRGLREIYSRQGRYYRQKKIDILMREIRSKKERYGLQYLYIVAEDFLSMSKERFDEFIEHYRNIRLPFWIETRPEGVTREKVLRLEEVGCEGISIGVEHGNYEFRKNLLNRKVTNSIIIKTFHVVKKTKIRTCVNNIIGFPTEVRDLIFDTIELNRELNADNIIVNIFSPYRGTKLREIAVEKGYLNPRTLAGDYRSEAIMKTPYLTPEQIKGLQRTFVMYVKFPRKMWPEIERCERFDEKGDKIFEQLKKRLEKRGLK